MRRDAPNGLDTHQNNPTKNAKIEIIHNLNKKTCNLKIAHTVSYLFEFA